MAETAFMTRYRNEFIAGFEVHASLLRDSVTTEVMVDGQIATFLVADSGSATAVTRGTNGLIPPRADNLTQSQATLTEEHDLVQKTGFNIFASQGDQRRIMQMTSMGVINRKVDSQILTALGTATNDTGASTEANLNLVTKARTILGNNKVPFDGNICAVISPAFEAYLDQTTEYASADFVNVKPLVDAGASFEDKPKVKMWMGVKWIVHPEVSGVGTNAEVCFMYHRNSIGHAVDKGRIAALIGVNNEQDYSWSRTTVFSGAKLLQNSGVVVMNHDGSAFAAS